MAEAVDPGRERGGGVTFALVIVGYLAITVAESILAPLFPAVAADLRLDLGLAGLAFGVLTGTIAIGNLLGGQVLSRYGPRPGLVTGLAVSAGGAALAASAGGSVDFVVSQAVVGLGTGIFFAPGLDAAGRSISARRRGLAMGVFGVAFSAGLTVAAFLAAFGAAGDWRLPFRVAALACLVGGVCAAVVRLPARPRPAPGRDGRWGRLLLVPIGVGSIGTISQYGTVAFLALFAVTTWGMSPAAAAGLVAAARVGSVGVKLGAGAAADRWGAGAALRALALVLVASGLAWTLAPSARWGAVPAVAYAAAVSGVFPVANLLALDAFGDRGMLLGTYRSGQIAVGAVAAWGIGLASSQVGMRPTLAATALIPLAALALTRREVVAA